MSLSSLSSPLSELNDLITKLDSAPNFVPDRKERLVSPLPSAPADAPALQPEVGLLL